MSEPSFVAETLEWCNEMRAEKNLEPLDTLPKGKKSDPLSCPCGKATGLSVQFYEAFLPEENGRSKLVCRLPEGVKEFVAAFDNGELPQYVEAEDGIYFDADGNSAPLDEALS